MPDATYLSEAALRAFQRRQKLEELDVEGGYDKTDLGESIRRLGEQRVGALQGTKEGANREGLIHSGQLGKRLGQVETNFARQQGDQQRDFDRREAARGAARRAIEAGAPLEEAAGLAAAADRQISRDSELADANALAPNPAAAPKPAPTVQQRQARAGHQAQRARVSTSAASAEATARARARTRRPRRP